MKTQNQMLWVILAIIFAVALALTVSIICLAADNTFSKSEVTPNTEKEATPKVENEEEDGLVFADNPDGSVTLIHVGSCKSACINIPEKTATGKLVTAIGEKAFFGCSTVAAVQIPASVKTLGDLAFANCEKLVYLSVDPASPYFSDDNGVLYSKDFSILYLYPCMHAGNRLFIPASVKEIKEMAFYHCAYLTNVTYPGNEESWEAIHIHSKNYSLSAAAKEFNAQTQ